jgi:uncharacterized membrane protein
MLASEAVLAPPGARAAATAAATRARLDSIDFLRGLVMVLMLLDHARDFVGAGGFNPRDVNDMALFLTRWITHFCAPVFVLLAGVSAFLYGQRGRRTSELSVYLFTRGLWLVFLEMTLVRFAWTFSLRVEFLVFQVMWVIGAAMILLAGLVHLPRRAVFGIGLALIVGHNLLDGIQAERFGAAGWIWHFLHQPALLELSPEVSVFPLYPLIPWVGVMALGYALGPVMMLPPTQRRRALLAAGFGTLLLFAALRLANGYGDPAAWSVQQDAAATLLSFINCEKYPPSLLYLAMTLGPALVLLALGKGARSAPTEGAPAESSILVTFGKVPMLFYLAHLFLLHGLAALVGTGTPDLGMVYAVSGAALVALYPLCRWFAALKARRGDWWLSYL